MSQKWSLDGGGKLQFNVFFLTWMHFGRQGLPMEFPSDFQEHFYTILTRFGHICGSLFAKKKKIHQKRKTNKVTDRETSCKSNEYVGTPNTQKKRKTRGGGVWLGY